MNFLFNNDIILFIYLVQIKYINMFRNLKLTLILSIISLHILSQTQIGNDINGKNEGDQLGWSTAISNDGSVVAVGASGKDDRIGYVQVFKSQNGVWNQLGNDILGENNEEFFGHAIALSDDGTIVAISAYNYSNNDNGYASNNYGRVKVYKYENNNWQQLGNTIFEKFTFGSNSKDQVDMHFGYSLDLNKEGTILAVGAPKADLLLPIHLDDVPNCGLVAIYTLENNDWGNPNTIYGEAEEDNSGNSISLSSNGRTLAIGASNNDGNGNNSGHVRIYKKIGLSWQLSGETGSKDIDGEFAYDLSGFSVSISGDGNYVAVGAPSNDGDDGNKTDSGHVKLLFYEGNNDQLDGRWFQFWGDIDGDESVDQFGYSVSLSENGLVLAAGSIDNDTNGSKSGHVRLFKVGTRLNNLGIDINGEASGDQAGFSVSISGDGTKVAVGAPFNDGNGSNSGHVRVYDLSEVLSTETNSLSNFNIYPNPATQQITLNLENSIFKKVSIYNNLGQIVKRSKSTKINISNLPSGIYFLQIETDKGKSSKKLIIN